MVGYPRTPNSEAIPASTHGQPKSHDTSITIMNISLGFSYNLCSPVFTGLSDSVWEPHWFLLDELLRLNCKNIRLRLSDCKRLGKKRFQHIAFLKVFRSRHFIHLLGCSFMLKCFSLQSTFTPNNDSDSLHLITSFSLRPPWNTA